MAETEEELKSFLMRVKEESGKAGLKLNIQKTNMTSGLIISWQIDGGKSRNESYETPRREVKSLSRVRLFVTP